MGRGEKSRYVSASGTPVSIFAQMESLYIARAWLLSAGQRRVSILKLSLLN